MDKPDEIVDGWVETWIEADKKRNDDLPDKVRKVLHAIRKLFRCEVKSKDLFAEDDGTRNISPVFAKWFDGLTPIKYLATARQTAAKKLLERTKLQIGVISDLLGYSSSSTFSSYFRDSVGISPSDYQARCSTRKTRLQEQTKSLVVTAQEEAELLVEQGDLDAAQQLLSLTTACGPVVDGPLPVDRFMISVDLKETLLSELCGGCRETLMSDKGWMVRRCLENALMLVPRDLEWFRDCCDPCYLKIWEAIDLARLGLIQDAWKAFWLAKHADPDDRTAPASLGRVIAALAEVQQMRSEDQVMRRRYSELAVKDADALGNPLLHAQARIWDASVLRGLGDFNAARTQLDDTADMSRMCVWFEALHANILGLTERDMTNLERAINSLRYSAEVYETCDKHMTGILLIEQGIVYFWMGEYQKSLGAYRRSKKLLDARRDPFAHSWFIPANTAMALALMGDLSSADEEIGRCDGDFESHPGRKAEKVVLQACLKLMRKQFAGSLVLFMYAREAFEDLNRPLDVALVSSFLVESYACLGNWTLARSNAVAALSFFEAAKCNQATLALARQLQELLHSESVDVDTVVNNVRRLTRMVGGWLPVPKTGSEILPV